MEEYISNYNIKYNTPDEYMITCILIVIFIEILLIVYLIKI